MKYIICHFICFYRIGISIVLVNINIYKVPQYFEHTSLIRNRRNKNTQIKVPFQGSRSISSPQQRSINTGINGTHCIYFSKINVDAVYFCIPFERDLYATQFCSIIRCQLFINFVASGGIFRTPLFGSLQAWTAVILRQVCCILDRIFLSIRAESLMQVEFNGILVFLPRTKRSCVLCFSNNNTFIMLTN